MAFDEQEARSAIDELLEILDRIPGASSLKKDVLRLKAILVDRRAPRVVVVGRRGHGKSSLANALIGREALKVGHVGDEPALDEWRALEADGRTLDWLDTSGLGAGGISAARLAKLEEQVSRTFPDVVLFACRATDVDSEIDSTLEGLKSILSALRRNESSAPLIVVLTRADEMFPAHENKPPYSATKLKNIHDAISKLRSHMDRHDVLPRATVPVSAYLTFGEDGGIAWDGRWNIDGLCQKIFEILPDSASMEAARAFDKVRGLRRKVARRIIGTCASAAFGIGAMPTGVPDVILLAPLQQTMVTSIVYLSGKKLEAKTIAEWIVGVSGSGAAGLGARELFRFLVKNIPAAGNIASGAMAGAWTYGLGLAAMAYFIDDQSLEESRTVFTRERSVGASWQPQQKDMDTDDTESVPQG